MEVSSEITVKGRLPSSTVLINKANPSRKIPSYSAMIVKKRMMTLIQKVETIQASTVKTV